MLTWPSSGSPWARVAPGQPLGIVGNTGNTAQFIDRTASCHRRRDSLWTQRPGSTPPIVQSHFGLRGTTPVARHRSTPHGPRWSIPMWRFYAIEGATTAGLAEPAIGRLHRRAARDQDIIAPCPARSMSFAGRRNTPSDHQRRRNHSSHLRSGWLAGHRWQAVRAGQVIGRWNPAARACTTRSSKMALS